MLEEILDYRNVHKALKQVISNKGAGGIDGMQTDELRVYLEANWHCLKASILAGNYSPSPVRKVEIPKANGRGVRNLGIPTVIDRLIQQAIHQWLTPQYDPEFSNNSYGFREGRNAHQAVLEAKQYLDEGKHWVIELDLEKFFDRVNHDKLMGLLGKRIKDKRTLKLIRSYLTSGVMEGGVISPRTEGTPQGSPLSPILSNIILHELDKELQRRGHSFVRYADDCSIYVRSEKSAHRVEKSITNFLEKELKLKVNREKTKVSRPDESTLLGFTFYQSRYGWIIKISPTSVKRIKDKLRAQTKRSDPTDVKEKIRRIVIVMKGWVNYFRICQDKRTMKTLDSMVRVRLRTGIWKQWKTPKNRIRNLLKLTVDMINLRKHFIWSWGYSSQGYYRIAHTPILQSTLSSEYFQKLGYVGFFQYYYWKTNHQTKLF